MAAWKLETAKARLSEVVRQAREHGPQTITVRGREAVVVIAPEDYHRLRGEPGENWVDRLRRECAVDFDFEFERNPDTGRDVDLGQ